MSISAVIFDLWNTLCYFDDDVMDDYEEEVVDYLNSFDKSVSIEDYHGLRKKYHVPATTGRLSVKALNEKIILDIGLPQASSVVLTDKMTGSFSKGVRICPGVPDLMAKLKSMDMKLGLITNCMEGTMEILKSIGLDVFDSYAFSDEVGARKPDKKIYLKVTSELGVDPSECVFISDEIFEDLVGAKNLGMKTIHIQVEKRYGIFEFDPDKKIIDPDATVSQVTEILGVIQEWAQ